MSSRTLALAHFVMSPPLPQPMSSTLPDRALRPRPVEFALAASTGCAKREMSTDLTQLLKFFRPMMGESRRCTTPTSGLALSGLGGL